MHVFGVLRTSTCLGALLPIIPMQRNEMVVFIFHSLLKTVRFVDVWMDVCVFVWLHSIRSVRNHMD